MPRRALLATSLSLLLALPGLAGCGGLAMDTASLREMGLSVYLDTDGWVRLRAPEGFSVAMPGVPAGETEEFSFGGHPIRGRFLDLSAIGHSRGFLFRSFDTRALEEPEREAIRLQAIRLFIPGGARTVQERRFREGGVLVDQRIIEGYSINGHEGVVRSFIQGGFVFQMLVISLPGSGLSGDSMAFFRSVRLSTPTE